MRFLLLILFVCVVMNTSFAQRALVPDHAVVQYAGSIGMGSFGIGYDAFGRHRFSLHYGYVPESVGGPLHIVASKLLFDIWTIRLSESTIFKPLDAGIMLTYHFGSQFRTHWPKHRYPEGYYWWKTSVRPHLLTETSVTFRLGDEGIRFLTGYIELNTNELYLISYVKNIRSLSITDIVKIGVGIRASF